MPERELLLTPLQKIYPQNKIHLELDDNEYIKLLTCYQFYLKHKKFNSIYNTKYNNIIGLIKNCMPLNAVVKQTADPEKYHPVHIDLEELDYTLSDIQTEDLNQYATICNILLNAMKSDNNINKKDFEDIKNIQDLSDFLEESTEYIFIVARETASTYYFYRRKQSM
jgi:hypothetical protein